MPFGRPGGRVRIDPGRHHLRLGARDLSGSATGVVSGAEAVTLEDDLSPIRFDPTGGHVLTGGSFDSATGQISLPIGHWLVSVSVRLTATFADGTEASMLAGAVAIQLNSSGGGTTEELVHGSSGLLLPSGNPLSQTLSVTGSLEITQLSNRVLGMVGVSAAGGDTTPTGIAIAAAVISAHQLHI